MSDTPLNYALFTEPELLQVNSEARLTIVVSSHAHAVVDCASISFEFLQGTGAKDFFSDSAGISPSAPEGWSVTSSGGLFAAVPDTKDGGKIGGEGLTFLFSNIQVNGQVGTTDLTITDVTGNHQSAQTIIPLAKFPAQFYVDDLTVKPDPPLEQGDSIVVSWSGSDEATYQLQYEDGDGNTVLIDHPKDEPNQPLPATGNYEIDNLQKDTTFYLTATVAAPAGDDPLVVTRFFPVAVEVPSVRIKSFSANQTVVYGANNNVAVTLTWETEHAQQLTVNGTLVDGTSLTVTVNQTTDFTLGATGTNGPVYAKITVTVEPVNLGIQWPIPGERGELWNHAFATFGANPGNYNVLFKMYDEPQGTSNPYVVSVGRSIEGISQVVTVDAGAVMFVARFEVTVSGFPSGPVNGLHLVT
jgi:hypothetical protein